MYRESESGRYVTRLKDNAIIPNDPENIDWVAYLNWRSGGHMPEPNPPTVVNVPHNVTMRQARKALLAVGLLQTVESVIQNLPEPVKTDALIEWEYSNEVLRHNGFVSQLAPLLNLTESQLDDLFIQASLL